MEKTEKNDRDQSDKKKVWLQDKIIEKTAVIVFLLTKI
jgi:hypothetical protein